MVQQLRVCASNGGGVSSIPGQGTKIPEDGQHDQKAKHKNNGLNSPSHT